MTKVTKTTDAGTDPALLFEKANGIATLKLNRPASRNALTTGMFLDMERLLIEIETDDEVRVVVITGTGRGFSSGADLKRESDAERARTRRASFPGDQGGDILDRGNRCMLRLHRLPKPVVGSINGDAVGIGCSLALATDLRIASDTAGRFNRGSPMPMKTRLLRISSNGGLVNLALIFPPKYRVLIVMLV